MVILETLNKIVLILGLPAVLGVCVYLGRILQRLDKLGVDMDTVKHNLNLCLVALTKSNMIDGDKIKAYSPLSLTEIGKEYLKKSGFIDLVNTEQYRKDLLSYIEREHPKTKYDVENIATKSVLAATERDYFNPVKNYLYNNPGENIVSFSAIAGVYVRDLYLQNHPEIKE